MKAKMGPSRTLFQVSGRASPLQPRLGLRPCQHRALGGRTSGGAMAHHTVKFWAGPPALLSQWHSRDSLGDMGVSARSRGPSSTVQSPDPPAAPSCRTQRGCRPLCPVSQLFLLFCSFFLPSFLLLALWIAVLSSENCSFHGPDGQALVPALLRCELQRGESPVVAACR